MASTFPDVVAAPAEQPPRVERAGNPATTLQRERLVQPMPADRLAGWLAPIAITVLAGILRLHAITQPRHNYFDETYYAHDSFNLLNHGVELNDSNTGAGYVVHPPLGKWMMALGEWLFDHGRTVTVAGKVFPASELSYRFAGAVCGTLVILMIARIARRMFRSTLLGCFAGVLVTLDGLEFVQSRIAMLDIFLLFWLVVALGFLVLDRDDGRRRLAREIGRGSPLSYPGPSLGFRWYRLGMFVALGAACAVKWDGVFFLVTFPLLAFGWDIGARRIAGIPAPVRAVAVREGMWTVYGLGLVPIAAVYLVTHWTAVAVVLTLAWLGAAGGWYVRQGRVEPGIRGGLAVLIKDASYSLSGAVAALAVYLAAWTGWFRADDQHAYDRRWHGEHGVIGSLKALWHYHVEAYNFHRMLDSPHPYASKPFSWLLLGRPVAYYYTGPKQGELGCTASAGCTREVLGIGTPAIWWLAAAAIVVAFGIWWARRDWRASLAVVGFATGFLPWVKYGYFNGGHERTMFFFYALPLLPFVVLALTLIAGVVLGSATASYTRRLVGSLAVGGYLLLVFLSFDLLFPVLTAEVIPIDSWHLRVSGWFPSWV